jgi:hypothetical protein
MIINVTQYLRPNGRKVVHEFEIDEKYKDQYNNLTAYGCHLTCEQLQTGHGVHYISHRLGDFQSVISAPGNFKEAEEKLLSLIEAFDHRLFEEWVEQQRAEGVAERCQ